MVTVRVPAFGTVTERVTPAASMPRVSKIGAPGFAPMVAAVGSFCTAVSATKVLGDVSTSRT